MELKEFNEIFKEKLKTTDIVLTDEQIEKFYTYMLLIQEWNEKINLTAILEPEEMIVKHFIDSLSIAKDIENGAKVIDVGTGAGFPGIPLKIYNDSINITLMDALNKRMLFLNEVASKLNLESGIEIVHGRAEEMAQNPKYREMYDVAVSRAVAPLNILLEYLVPFVKKSGKVVAMKGSSSDEEVKDAKNAFSVLKCKIIESRKIELPDNQGERNILVIEKYETTPKTYPRKAGTPKKNPL